MRYEVFILSDAEEDLFDIYRYVVATDSSQKAKDLLTNLEETCYRLSKFPKIGHVPPELERIGIFEYKEILYKPYRIIYHISGKDVYIHCILDGRRDLQQLLQERLLR